MKSDGNAKDEREESRNSEQSTTVRRKRRLSPSIDSIETDPEECSSRKEGSHKGIEVASGRGEEAIPNAMSARRGEVPKCEEPKGTMSNGGPWSKKRVEPAPIGAATRISASEKDSRYDPEMEVDFRTKSLSSRKGCYRNEVSVSSSSSEGSQDAHVQTELSQRSEVIMDLRRTVSRLQSLQRQIAVTTEQYAARMTVLQGQQEECTAVLWHQQKLQGELQAKYAGATPQEGSSNWRDEGVPVVTRSEEVSTRVREVQCGECGDGNPHKVMCSQRPITHPVFKSMEDARKGEVAPQPDSEKSDD